MDHAEQAVAFFWNDIKVAAKALLKSATQTGDELAAAIRAARQKTRRRLRIGDPPTFALSASSVLPAIVVAAIVPPPRNGRASGAHSGLRALDDGTATLHAINSYATNAVSARILNNLIAIRSFEEKWISNKPELGTEDKRRLVGSPAVIDLQCAFGGIKSAFRGIRE